ncbi:Frataxin [Dentipellis sp. KUC8613]|nr:Frataxin [Dentipellis sp. KUC8613]
MTSSLDTATADKRPESKFLKGSWCTMSLSSSSASRTVTRLLTRRSLVHACRIPATRACQRRVSLSQTVAQKRYYATPPPQFNTSALPIEEYHALSDATMDTMLDSLEALLDELGDPSYEVEYSSGVLTLKLGNNGTYVINKQPPNKQIWLSSPFSGPKRYDYVSEEDDWIYSRDGQALGTLLNTELSRVFKQEVDLGLADVSKNVV